MKRIVFFAAFLAVFCGSFADIYTRVTKFDKIGTEFRDTFLVVCEHAGNAYIFDGQTATNRNYKLIENFSGNTISGDYSENECVLLHNKWHGYNKLCSMLSRGDGNRPSGYYLGGVSGGNGITFSNGQLDVELTWQGELGIDILTKNGSGNFQFNTADKVFKFYSQSGQKRPILFVKGNGEGYVGEDESVNILNVNYVQADLYTRYSDFGKNLYFWDLRLLKEETDEKTEGIETSIQSASKTAIAGNYSQKTAATQAGWIATNSYIYFPSREGVTQGKVSEMTLKLTPKSRYNDLWYNYQIELYCVDSNKKRWKLDKILPIFCTFTDRDPSDKEYDLQPVDHKMNENLPSAITLVSTDELQIFATDGTIFGADKLQIFNLQGQDVTHENGRLQGVYIVKSNEKVAKILVP